MFFSVLFLLCSMSISFLLATILNTASLPCCFFLLCIGFRSIFFFVLPFEFLHVIFRKKTEHLFNEFFSIIMSSFDYFFFVCNYSKEIISLFYFQLYPLIVGILDFKKEKKKKCFQLMRWTLKKYYFEIQPRKPKRSCYCS